MNKEVYLDNCATTKPRQEVVDAMLNTLTTEYGNPSSLHSKGIEIEKLIKESRKNVATIFSCKPEEIYFTSGGTQSNNFAITGTAMANNRDGNHIITTKFEHSSVLNIFKALEKKGYNVTYLDVTHDGFVKLDELEKAVNDNTILVSIMHVNNEVGTIQPIQDAVKIIKQKNNNTKIHVDAVQSYTKISVDPHELGVDLMTVSSHKIHGPKGVGAVFIKKGTKVNNLLYGGQQEGGLNPGTENVPGIIGFGKAAELEYADMKDENLQIKNLRDNLEQKILSSIPDAVLNGKKEVRAPHILNISFLGVKGEVLLRSLSETGIYVSTVSACSSRKNAHSHVLEAMGVSQKGMEGAIRFSLGAFNTKEDIDYCVENLESIVKKLRNFKRG